MLYPKPCHNEPFYKEVEVYHNIFTCDLFKNERGILQSTVEDILKREDSNLFSDIMKTLNGIVDNISKQAQNEILSAFHQYMKSTNRFMQN